MFENATNTMTSSRTLAEKIIDPLIIPDACISSDWKYQSEMLASRKLPAFSRKHLLNTTYSTEILF